MKKISRETIIRRAITWSLLQEKYRDIIKEKKIFEAKLKSCKITKHNLDLIEYEAKETIEKLKRLVKNNINRLFYEDLKIPQKESKLKIFGEIKESEYLIEIIGSTYNSIDYVSSFELKQGYISLNELTTNLLEIEEKEMILNLTTGEYVCRTKGEIAKCKPVSPIINNRIILDPKVY